jgi:hypothetical protein
MKITISMNKELQLYKTVFLFWQTNYNKSEHKRYKFFQVLHHLSILPINQYRQSDELKSGLAVYQVFIFVFVNSNPVNQIIKKIINSEKLIVLIYIKTIVNWIMLPQE